MSEKIPTQMVLQIAEAIKKLSIEHVNAALVIQAYCAQHDYHETEVKKLRQTHWDMRAQAGFDNDGDPTPEAVVSNFSVLMIDDWNTVIRNQQESHDEWDALQQENITLRTKLDALRKQEPVGIKSVILDIAPSGTTHIRKSGRRSFSGGEFAVYFECFKFEAGEWSYYYTDNDNEYPHWRSLNGGHYRKPDEIIKTLIPLATTPAPVAPIEASHPNCNYRGWLGRVCTKCGEIHNEVPPQYLFGEPDVDTVKAQEGK